MRDFIGYDTKGIIVIPEPPKGEPVRIGDEIRGVRDGTSTVFRVSRLGLPTLGIAFDGKHYSMAEIQCYHGKALIVIKSFDENEPILVSHFPLNYEWFHGELYNKGN